MKNIKFILILSALLGGMSVHAQDSGSKLTVKPTGRILMDAAAYIGGNDDAESVGDTKFVDGVGIPDVRLGAKATYGKWKAKIDIGFSYGKVGLKDTYFEYDFNDANLLRGGYFVPQWGLNSETSSSMKPSYEEPTANEFFNANPRLLALMWQYDKGQFLAGTSIFAEAAAMTKNATMLGKQAWGAQTRLVWRPLHANGNVLQTGISLNYTSPNDEDHHGFVYKSNFPSRVSKITELNATIEEARGSFKLSPELLLIKGRIALESQYYYMRISRRNELPSYDAHGVYGMFRVLLLGNEYCYNHADGGVATPSKGSLELVGGYSYVDASDHGAGVRGGIANDVNFTINYYINKYMIARLRYSYTNVHDREVANLLPSRHVNTLEARLQIIF